MPACELCQKVAAECVVYCACRRARVKVCYHCVPRTAARIGIAVYRDVHNEAGLHDDCAYRGESEVVA